MTKNIDINYINSCVSLIETRLNWGKSSEWTNYDFEKLSVAIQDKTGVTLSVTTLKRLWGKLKYENMPAVTTLNTLAKFAGFEDWRDFKQQGAVQVLPSATDLPVSPSATDLQVSASATDLPVLPSVTDFPISPSATDLPVSPSVTDLPVSSSVPNLQELPKKTAPSRKRGIWLLGLLILPAIFLVSNRKPPLNPAAFKFSSNKVRMEGVPNSVVFNYDATAAGKGDVYIAQSWDVRRKMRVSASEKVYSTIYYVPGYFRAKLMVGDQIMKEHDLMIASGGWLALLEKENDVPLYFKKEEFQYPDSIAVSAAVLSGYNVALQPALPALRFYNVRDMEGIQDDNFTFETTLKSEYDQGTSACQRIEVLILCKNDVIIIPLCAKGCVGNLQLYAAGASVGSGVADLSKFGCDLRQWVNVKVVAKDRHMQFFVNGVEAYALDCPDMPVDIVGVEYRFNGIGVVKGTRFIRGDKVIVL